MQRGGVLYVDRLSTTFWQALDASNYATLSNKEDGFAFLRKSHGGCDMPLVCRQEPPFESVPQMPIRRKRPIRKDWSFSGRLD